MEHLWALLRKTFGRHTKHGKGTIIYVQSEKTNRSGSHEWRRSARTWNLIKRLAKKLVQKFFGQRISRHYLAMNERCEPRGEEWANAESPGSGYSSWNSGAGHIIYSTRLRDPRSSSRSRSRKKMGAKKRGSKRLRKKKKPEEKQDLSKSVKRREAKTIESGI